MIIQVLCDSPNSWMVEYAKTFVGEMQQKKYNISFTQNPDEIKEGDILVMLSCEKIFKNLGLNKHNLVVHESDLPKGKGWSPLTWQVLEGKKQIPVTLFEAVESVDSGVIYGQEIINLTGLELVDELRDLQAKATIKLIKKFIFDYPNNPSKPQEGESTFYKKRIGKDSELDINKTIAEQFNMLRVCDNERYPAFFIIEEKRYILKITKEPN